MELTSVFSHPAQLAPRGCSRKSGCARLASAVTCLRSNERHRSNSRRQGEQMHPSTDRRQFVKSLVAGATAGLLPTFAPLTVQVAAQGDFLMTDGLTYLNTGTIGPSRRATIDATQRAWEMLEANPIAHYGQRVGAPMLEDTRTVAAKFLGCDLDEMAVTGSTTAGMNAIAQGLRLGAGDRVLLTDQEHSGGLHCWQYLARHHGVELGGLPYHKANIAQRPSWTPSRKASALARGSSASVTYSRRRASACPSPRSRHWRARAG